MDCLNPLGAKFYIACESGRADEVQNTEFLALSPEIVRIGALIALQSGNLPILEYLVSARGAPITVHGIISAIQHGHFEAARWAFDRARDIVATLDRDGARVFLETVIASDVPIDLAGDMFDAIDIPENNYTLFNSMARLGRVEMFKRILKARPAFLDSVPVMTGLYNRAFLHQCGIDFTDSEFELVCVCEFESMLRDAILARDKARIRVLMRTNMPVPQALRELAESHGLNLN